jgi:photosystem II stability/assembly factor-like uncharacterized protein
MIGSFSFSKLIFICLLLFLTFDSINSQTGFVIGDFGTLIKTTDGGNSWSIKETGMVQTLFKTYFIDNQTGWIAGGTTTRFIIKTTDQGETWNQQFMINSGLLRCVWFVSGSTGYAVGSFGTVLRTTNGGTNWDSTTVIGGNILLQTICFPFSTTGFVTGSNGTLFKTTNGGNNWIALNSNTTNNLYASYFRSVRIGWVGGTGGLIQETINGGSNWTVQNTGTTQDLYSIFFLDNANGWSVGHQGTIIRTTNGGATWTPQTSPSTASFESVTFANLLTGWIVGGSDGSVILNTTDGGNNWFTLSGVTSQHLYSEWFFPSPLEIKHISYNTPTTFNLSQNYPNPFNPSTKFNYQIPVTNFVKLVIYDILGREIQTLINEKQSAGSYEIEWDGSNHPSGVYFYTLTAANFHDTKTMVLLK